MAAESRITWQNILRIERVKWQLKAESHGRILSIERAKWQLKAESHGRKNLWHKMVIIIILSQLAWKNPLHTIDMKC